MAWGDPGTYTSTSTSSANDPGAMSQDYMQTVADKTLHPNLEFYQHGSSALMAAQQGLTIYAPYFVDGSTKAPVLTEGQIQDPNTISANKHTGTIRQFGKATGFSDVQVATRTLRQVAEEAVEQDTVALAKAYESEIIYGPGGNDASPDPLDASANDGILIDPGAIDSAEKWDAPVANPASENWGMWESPDQSTDYGSCTSTTAMVPKALFAARRRLRKKNCQSFSNLNNTYAALLSVDATFDVITNTSANSLTIERASMHMEDVFASNIIGRLGGCTVVEFSWDGTEFTSNSLNQFGGADGAEMVMNFVFGAGAYWVSDLENMRPEVIMHGFGSAGSRDPLNQLATSGVKGSMGVIVGNLWERMVYIPSGLETE